MLIGRITIIIIKNIFFHLFAKFRQFLISYFTASYYFSTIILT